MIFWKVVLKYHFILIITQSNDGKIYQCGITVSRNLIVLELFNAGLRNE